MFTFPAPYKISLDYKIKNSNQPDGCWKEHTLKAVGP